MTEATATLSPLESSSSAWTALHYIAAATGLVLIILGCVL